MLTLRKLKLKTTVARGTDWKARRRPALLLLTCLLAMNAVAVAQRVGDPLRPASGGHNHMPVPAKPDGSQPEAKAEAAIPDVEVLDQNGETRKFYSDLVKGRVVIINFIYTTCTGICPMSGANFSRLQTVLGDRLGREVYLISVTTDPDTDSPAKLKAWGARFSAKAGWTLVTGQKKEMTALLRALTGDGPGTGYHVPGISIVNDPKGNRRRVYGLEAPDQLLKLADELAQQPGLSH